jgi:hypothetical protein
LLTVASWTAFGRFIFSSDLLTVCLKCFCWLVLSMESILCHGEGRDFVNNVVSSRTYIIITKMMMIISSLWKNENNRTKRKSGWFENWSEISRIQSRNPITRSITLLALSMLLISCFSRL